MQGITILKPNLREWKLIQDLRIFAVQDAPCAFGQNLEEALATGEEEWRRRLAAGEYLCAKDESTGDYVGMVCAVQEQNSKSKHVANIYSMYICPEQRGKGVGRSLMTALIEDIHQRMPEVKKIILRVTATQKEAKAMYESLGFIEEGCLKRELCINGKFIDSYIMSKFIGTI
jgi:ribosomal protein S18 acetylase RimI-like enzyme